MKVAKLCLSLLLLLAPAAFAQTRKAPAHAVANETPIVEIYNREGWQVPGLQGAASAGASLPVLTLPGVTATLYRPGAETARVVLIAPSREAKGRMDYTDAPARIVALTAYALHGRVFAWAVAYVRTASGEGQGGGLGAPSLVYYFDLDGSGRFVSMRLDQGLLPSFAPDWAKKP